MFNWKNVRDIVLAMVIAMLIVELMGWGFSAIKTAQAKKKAENNASTYDSSHNDGTISDEEMEAYAEAA